jgi:hypothetical protein
MKLWSSSTSMDELIIIKNNAGLILAREFFAVVPG